MSLTPAIGGGGNFPSIIPCRNSRPVVSRTFSSGVTPPSTKRAAALSPCSVQFDLLMEYLQRVGMPIAARAPGVNTCIYTILSRSQCQFAVVIGRRTKSAARFARRGTARPKLEQEADERNLTPVGQRHRSRGGRGKLYGQRADVAIDHAGRLEA